MRNVITMAIILTAATASAQWHDWPMDGKTNHAYYGIQQAYNPVSQLWYSVAERAQVSGAQGQATLQWEADAGTNVTITTNGTGHVFTNVSLVTTTLTYTVSITDPTTNDITSPLVYTYTDFSGLHTATSALPYLSGEISPARQGVMYAIDSWLHGTAPQQGVGRYVVTNHSVAGNFNDYFGNTDAEGDRPQDLPKYTWASLQYYEGYGFGTNYTSNSWGYITGSAVTNDRAWFTHYPSNAVYWPIAEAVSDGTNWATKGIMTLGTNGAVSPARKGSYLTDPSIKPVLLYQHGTNNIASHDVTITGKVYKAVWTSLSRVLVDASETITATGTNDCTEQWYSISSITVDDPANARDSYSVIYTNTLAMYAEWGEWQRLYAMCLDERWKRNHALLWTDASHAAAGVDWVPDGINQYIYSGTSNSYAGAQTEYINSSPSTSEIDLPPAFFIEASTDGTNYTITGTSRRAKPVLLGGTAITNYARKAEFYLMANAVQGGTFDGQGYDVIDNRYTNMVDSSIGISGAITSSAYVGILGLPVNFPAAPTVGTDRLIGWEMTNDILGLVRWDVTDATHPEFSYQNE